MLSSAVLLLALLCCTCAENPAIQFILTDKGLHYGKHKGTDWVQENLKRVTVPDISGEVSIGLLGSVDYTLSDITVTKCDLPEPSVDFDPDVSGLKTSISGLSVSLSGSWSLRFSFIHDGGSFDMAVYNLNAMSVVKLGNDSDGHLSVTSAHCDARVGDVDVRFHGGASWIFDRFVEHFKGRIISDISERICPGVEQMIVKLESHLQAMNVSVNVDQVLTLDVPLTGLPAIDASSLKLALKGEFYNTRTHGEPPFTAKAFTLPEQQDYMLSVGLSEFSLNSASYGYYTAGLLQVDVTDSMILQHLHMHLNTSVVGLLVPPLLKMFPGLLMSLKVYARGPPVFSLEPDVVKLGVQGAIKAFAIQKNRTQTPLFTLSVASKFSTKVWISDGKLRGSLKMDNFTLKLTASEVGTFSTRDLENLVKCGMQTVVFPKLNKKLTEGVDLPRMKQAQLINSVLKVEKGFMAMSSDAEVFLPEGGFN